MCPMIEAHFCGIASQSSIYGLTSLFTGESSHKVLVASSKRKVYCIEYSKNQQSVIFSTREVQFTYIPGPAEIICIDAFNQVCHIHDFAVGITFTKTDNGKQSQYFNVYSELTPSSEFDLDNIAQGCLSIGLDYIPFHLTHTELCIDGKKEMVWLISGSDFKVHLYKEDRTRQTYSEEPSDTCFPEFIDLNSVVMYMDFYTTVDSRLTALGCKDGSVIVTSVSFSPEIHLESSWKIQHDGPISTIRLFRDSDLEDMLFNNFLSEEHAEKNINLFVGNTLENSVVYRDILKEGLKLASQKDLPSSNKFDCVTCGLVVDIDMDGNNEVILGTYGQQLLVYKWEVKSAEDEGSYVLFHQRMFPNPLLAMSYIDIVGDGLKELLILTTKGLHILQHDLKQATDLCKLRMKWLLQNVSTEELENYLKLDE